MDIRTFGRFLIKIAVQPNGCWLWTGARNGGYGWFRVNSNRSIKAHIFAYELWIGSIPEGKELDHLCDTPLCVKPWHLEAVTHQENTLRGTSPTAINARKTHCIRDHLLSGDNLYIRPDGGRHCRTCQRVRYHQRRRALSV